MSRSLKLASASTLVLALLAIPALAAEEPAKTGIWERDQLTGDWGGTRTHLADSGLTFGASEVVDAFANVSGGIHQQGEVMGKLELDLDTDFEKIFGLKGLTGHASAFSTHGRSLGGTSLGGNIMPPSNIEAEQHVRLFTLWLEQTMFDGMANLRFGQLAADDEFALSDYGGMFTNASLGWPAAFASDFPNGGPAYPLATPGIRLKVGEDKPWSVMAAVFNGDPAPGTNSGQTNNPSGTRFELDSGALFMLEGAYKRGDEKGPLPGTYKLGAWFHTSDFGDLRRDNTGLSLADPGSTGTAATHSGNYGLYAIADQMLWRDGNEGDKGIGAFVKFFYQPQEDRNLVTWQGDVGMNAKGLFFGRENDTLGVAFSYANVSHRASQLDEDTNGFTAVNGPVRDYEAAIEIAYQAQVTPWLIVQPDFQYIIHPGGSIVDPTDAAGTKAIGDAAVVGVRTAVTF